MYYLFDADVFDHKHVYIKVVKQMRLILIYCSAKSAEIPLTK